MANLSLCHVSKSLAAHKIIHDMSVDINDGEMIVVVGPSGCGKTTLLRMIAGLEEVTSGEIKINNRTVNHLEPKNRNVAMVFQNYALYPHMTVYNNMAYGLRMRNLSKIEIKERVHKVASTLALTPVLHRTPKQLSGGQRQRVAMGRAMVREPAIFLFDEPLSNLDANLRVQMRLEIKQLQKQTQVTSIYVTHDQIEAMTLADRLIVMDHGVVEQIGTPLEIYQKPATRFVAGFMGSPAMNFITGKVENENTISFNNGTSFKYQNPNLNKLIGKNIFVGIRPECFSLESNLLNANHIELIVEQIESLGSDTLLHGTISESEQKIIARVHGYWQGSIDQKIKFSVESQHLHFFEEEKGLRL